MATKRYTPPATIHSASLDELLGGVRSVPATQQKRLVADTIYYAGDPSLVRLPSVAIVGSREASEEGRRRAARLARELARRGVVVVSGLAMGIDGEAHRSAIQHGGRTIAVLGTPLNKVTPSSHASLLETICQEHLAVSPYAVGAAVYPSNFPERNKLMAALTDATVIIEASDTSGTLHQAAECDRLGRWLLIAKNVADNPKLKWPKSFLENSKSGKVRVLAEVDDLLSVLPAVSGEISCPSPSSATVPT
jgi:DNA processing protein